MSSGSGFGRGGGLRRKLSSDVLMEDIEEEVNDSMDFGAFNTTAAGGGVDEIDPLSGSLFPPTDSFMDPKIAKSTSRPSRTSATSRMDSSAPSSSSSRRGGGSSSMGGMGPISSGSDTDNIDGIMGMDAFGGGVTGAVVVAKRSDHERPNTLTVDDMDDAGDDMFSLGASMTDIGLKEVGGSTPVQRHKVVAPDYDSADDDDDDDDDDEDDEEEEEEKRREEEAAAAARAAAEAEERKLLDALAAVLPEEYIYDPFNAQPHLENLRQVKEAAEKAAGGGGSDSGGGSSSNKNNNSNNNSWADTLVLSELLKAADADALLHAARMRASILGDPTLVDTYRPESDEDWRERSYRRERRHTEVQQLEQRARDILSALEAGPSRTQFTAKEIVAERLERWERALELYVRCPDQSHLDLLGLLEKLCDSVTTSAASAGGAAASSKGSGKTGGAGGASKVTGTEESSEDLSDALSKASHMCTSLVELTSQAVRDATEDAAEAEDGYHIRLEAHSMVSERVMDATERIKEQYRTNGRAALKIGRQLELAEAKRRQCESASTLIRRWWMMENLAEQEELSEAEIRVAEEIRGVIPPSSCRLDPLFTRPENSKEAARALKSLRTVVRCRSSANKAAGGSGGGAGATSALVDPTSARRFDITSQLIYRVSNALEARLLNSFSEVYSRGGTYDFSSEAASTRSGRLDWVELRELADALSSFDSGKSLQKRYVQMVVTTRFPELFSTGASNSELFGTGSRRRQVRGDGGEEYDEEDYDEDELEEFDMDATRSKLSTLFHRVCEVCTAEFELIAHVFKPAPTTTTTTTTTTVGGKISRTTTTVASPPAPGSELVPLQVARALLQRVISDPRKGLQRRINDLLASIDRRGDFDAGAKKLDTFVVIHEKAAGLFSLLKEAAERAFTVSSSSSSSSNNAGSSGASVSSASTGTATTATGTTKTGTTAGDSAGASQSQSSSEANERAVTSLIQFLVSQEMALSTGHRRGYLNLELRLLHHECCAGLDRIGAKLLRPRPANDYHHSLRGESKTNGGSSVPDFHAPVMPLDKDALKKGGLTELLNGPLKTSVLRQPLIYATDSLARARLMFGEGHAASTSAAATTTAAAASGEDSHSTARVILAIYSQMCTFYGQSYLFPIIETLGEVLDTTPPSQPPNLPFDEDLSPPDLGVPGSFWVGIERIHSAAKAFDRELWAENRIGSVRVWEILGQTHNAVCMSLARQGRLQFFSEMEQLGEAAMLRALDTLSTHIQWILVVGGESMLATGNNRLLSTITGQGGGGPYAVPAGSSLEASNSPAVKSLTFCLRAQFVQIQAALTPVSLSGFWTALSMRLYDILVARLLQHYLVSTVGAVILSRDVEALRSVAMLAGTHHAHWDNLRELLTLYMTPPDSLKTMLVGADGDVNSGKGLFARAGKDQSLVFMSRRVDYRFKSNQGLKKCQWAVDLLDDLGVQDPTDYPINIALFAAGRKPN